MTRFLQCCLVGASGVVVDMGTLCLWTPVTPFITHQFPSPPPASLGAWTLALL